MTTDICGHVLGGVVTRACQSLIYTIYGDIWYYDSIQRTDGMTLLSLN